MRAAEFRSDPALVSQWKEMLEKHALLRLVLFDVMQEEHPTRFIVHEDRNGDISPTMASLELGETRGYSKYDNGLRLLAIPFSRPEPMPETTYEPEEPETLKIVIPKTPRKRRK